jgi:hypothetical protein
LKLVLQTNRNDQKKNNPLFFRGEIGFIVDERHKNKPKDIKADDKQDEKKIGM